MSVVIGCDSFLSLRNVRNGDLGRRLGNERVKILVDPNQYKGSQTVCPPGVELDRLLEFDAHADPELSRLVQRSYYTRKCYYDPESIWIKFRASSYRNKVGLRRIASLAMARYRLASNWVSGWLGFAQPRRRRVMQALRQHRISTEYRRLLSNWDAGVVVGMSPEGLREMALVEAANELRIPTVVMIRSRDNLASKIQHLPEADAYLVWSDVTREFMLRMYPEIPPERVHVTGSPQFDHHLDPAYRLDRETFFAKVGLDPARPLVVMTMSTPGVNDHEIDIAQHLADAAHSGRFARSAQLLVRGHPRMFGSDVRLLRQEYKEARAYPPPSPPSYRGREHEEELVRLILEDEPVHLATLAHQDVQVNVSGTMTIDSAIFDKPTVNIYYDLLPDIPAGLSVRRSYRRTDIRQMMSYGVSRLAHDPDECIRLINRYLDDPTVDAAGRARARAGECGPLDGQAGARIARAIELVALRNVPCSV
ncbi:MAG: hypothetical protein ACREBG_23380 [Pyrinomonadaceae bacterium]